MQKASSSSYCQRCFSSFDNTSKPIILPDCSHIVCSDCLLHLRKESQIICPQCQKGSALENVSAFQIDQKLLDNIDKLKKEEKIPTIVLIGRTGSGKSALGNKIADKTIFVEGSNLWSETKHAIEKIIEIKGRKIRIIDTQGFGDTSQGAATVIKNLLTFLTTLKGGFNLGIYCLTGKKRVDEHDTLELKILGKLLGNDVFRHTLIAVTQTNELRPETKKDLENKYIEQLPIRLTEAQLPDFKGRTLIADFDNFEESFLKPLIIHLAEHDMLRITLGEGLDLNDPKSIQMVIASGEMQGIINDLKDQQKQVKELIEVLGEKSEQINQLNSVIAGYDDLRKNDQKVLADLAKQIAESKAAFEKKEREQFAQFQRELNKQAEIGKLEIEKTSQKIQKPKLLAVHRWFNAQICNHFYCLDTNGEGAKEYVNEGIKFYTLVDQANGSLPLYRFWLSSMNDHFYTCNKSEGEIAKGNLEGYIGYVYQSQVTGTVPLHRYFNGTGKNHFYTINPNEEVLDGYKHTGIAGYVYSTQ